MNAIFSGLLPQGIAATSTGKRTFSPFGPSKGQGSAETLAGLLSKPMLKRALIKQGQSPCPTGLSGGWFVAGKGSPMGASGPTGFVGRVIYGRRATQGQSPWVSWLVYKTV